MMTGDGDKLLWAGDQQQQQRHVNGIVFVDDFVAAEVSQNRHFRLDDDEVDQVIATADHSAAIVLYQR